MAKMREVYKTHVRARSDDKLPFPDLPTSWPANTHGGGGMGQHIIKKRVLLAGHALGCSFTRHSSIRWTDVCGHHCSIVVCLYGGCYVTAHVSTSFHIKQLGAS